MRFSAQWLSEELERHVAQPADADDTNPAGRMHSALDDGIEDRDAAAKQWPRAFRIERIRQRTRSANPP